MRKGIVIITLICITGFFFCASSVYAAEENKVVRFFKNLVNWPFSVTKKGAETVGRTTAKPITAVTKTGSSTVDAVTGRPEKIKDVIIEPAKVGPETGVIAVEGTVKTPIEGTTEAFEEKK